MAMEQDVGQGVGLGVLFSNFTKTNQPTNQSFPKCNLPPYRLQLLKEKQNSTRMFNAIS